MDTPPYDEGFRRRPGGLYAVARVRGPVTWRTPFPPTRVSRAVPPIRCHPRPEGLPPTRVDLRMVSQRNRLW